MDEKEFLEQLKKYQLPVVVDFWAPWCSPCKMIDPLMKKLSQEYTGRVDVWKVNVDESPELRSTLHILGITTLIVFRNGQEITRCTGAAPLPVLNMLFDIALSGEAPKQPIFRLREHLVVMSLGFAKLVSRVDKAFSKGYIGIKLPGRQANH